jgi:hypothetical protein
MEPEQYDVIAFDKQGQTSIFASYPEDEKP